MKLKINTQEFQNMVAKATKGASVGNISLTQLMSISLKENTLTLITTDGPNFLYVTKDKVAGDDFSVVVPVEKFSKLISKLTCEDVTLEVVEKDGELAKLVVRGNGKYEIELPYDEEGDLVEFPDPIAEIVDGDDEGWDNTEVNLSTIRLVLSTAKAALMTGSEALCYTGYYCGDRIVTTDTYKICGIDVNMFDEPKLIPVELMDLLDLMTEEKVTVTYKDDTFIFETKNISVLGHTLEGIEDYQIEAISSLLDEKFSSSCKVEKSELLRMLDRISLFVDVFDKNSVYLTFTKEGLEVSSKKDSGAEVIPYKESTKFKPYTCCLDIELFKTQVKASPADIVEILYGKDNSIKFVNGNVKQVLALADDDRAVNSEQEEEDDDEN